MKNSVLSFYFVLVVALFGILFSLPSGTFGDSWLGNKLDQSKISLGLDLIGGTELDYEIDLSEAQELNSDDDPQNNVNIEWIAESVRDSLEERVNPAGVGEIIVKRSKVDDQEHILIQMPPSSNVAQAKADAERDNRLEFYEQNPEREEIYRGNITDFLAQVNSQDFESMGTELAENDDLVNFEVVAPAYKDGISDPVLAEKVFAAKEGEVLSEIVETTVTPVISFDDEGNQTYSGRFARVLALVKVNEVDTKERSKTTQAEAQARHILLGYTGSLRAPEDVPYATKEEAQAKAEELLAQIKDGADFAELATEFSTGPSATEGGDLGTFSPGSMIGPFNDAVFGAEVEDFTTIESTTEPRLVPEVVETDFGIHIIEVLSVTPEKTEDVTETIVGYQMITWDRDELQWTKTELDGSHLEAASPSYDQQIGTPVVALRFTAEGGELFAAMTERIAARRCNETYCALGAKVGGQWVSQATVRQKIIGRDSIISGNFTFDEVKGLANGLNLGAIAAPVRLSGQTTIKAELGEDQLQKSLKAAGFGLGATILFMIFMYRMAGVVAGVALLIYMTLFVAILKTWPTSFGGPIVLSLSGVAGIALSVGLAVDGNILIFERMKEEVRNGKTLKKAIELGFARAWNAIRDSNLTTLIICLILFVMGSSIIQGFAIMLIVGTLLSMFSAITISRTLLRFLVLFEPLNKPELFACKKTKNK